MQVTLNDIELPLKPWDTFTSLLSQYALEKAESGLLLPLEAYRFSEEALQSSLQDGTSLTVYTLFDEVKDLDPTTWLSQISTWKRYYPSLTSEQHLVIYLLSQGYDAQSRLRLESWISNLMASGLLELPTMPRLGRGQTLSSLMMDRIMKLMANWESQTEYSLQRVQEELRLFQQRSKELDITPLPWSEFVLEKTTMQLVPDYPSDMSLVFIFNDAVLNETIPYLILVSQGRVLYKIHDSYSSQDKAIHKSYHEDGLYFHVDGQETRWSPHHVIEVDYTIIPPIEDTVRQLARVFQTEMPFKLKEPASQIRVSGYFMSSQLQSQPVHMMMLADMAMTVPMAWSHLLLNESRTAFSQKKIHSFIYVDDTTKKTSKSQQLRASLLQEKMTLKELPERRATSEKGKGKTKKGSTQYQLRFNISRAPHLVAVHGFQRLMGQLIAMLFQQQDALLAQYKDVYGPMAKALNTYLDRIEKVKVDRKTGDRLAMLQEVFPDMYPAGYSRKCTKPRQPMLVDPSLVDQYPVEKIIQLEHDGETLHYACQSLEEIQRETEQEFVFPGYMRNTLANKSEYPILPCCFKNDQYAADSLLRKIVLEKQGQTIKDKRKRGGYGHLLGVNKMVIQEDTGHHRFGRLVSNIEEVYRNAGVEASVMLDKKTPVFSVIRMGVPKSSASILHCLEHIFNSEYKAMDYEARVNHVNGLRASFDPEQLLVCAQELKFMAPDQAKESWTNTSLYLDPCVWIRWLEMIYTTNIYLFEVSQAWPNGNLLQPYAIGPHLRLKSYARSIALIVHQPAIRKDMPQCELIVQLKQKPSGSTRKEFIMELMSPLDIAFTQTFGLGYQVHLVPAIKNI